MANRFPWRFYLLVLALLLVCTLLLAHFGGLALSLPLGGGALLVWAIMFSIHWLAWRRHSPSKDKLP